MTYNTKFFKDRLNSDFALADHAELGSIKLIDVSPLNPSTEGTEAFSLLFESPTQSVMPQQAYRLTAEGFEDAVFLVPVGQDENGTRYEAVFN